MRKIIIVSLLYLSSCSKTDVSGLTLNNESLIKSGDIVVLNGGDNSLSIIDPISLTERKRHYLELDIQGFAHHLHLSTSKEKLSIALPNYDFSQGHGDAHKSNKSGAILEVNTKDGSVSKIIKVGALNHNAIFNNDESEIWASLIKEAGKI